MTIVGTSGSKWTNLTFSSGSDSRPTYAASTVATETTEANTSTVSGNLVDRTPNVPLDTPAQAPIDYDGHILDTQISNSGKLTGGHSTANGNINVVSAGPPNSQGVYEAKISVPDPQNPGQYLTKQSTMFPDNWSAAQVQSEVDFAFANRTSVPGRSNMWQGTTPSGVAVTGYLSPKVTVYPKM